MFTITPFRRAACALPIAALGAVLSATAQAAPPNFDDFVNAYIYGYGPTAFAATEAVTTAVPNATTTPGASPRNQFSYSTALDTPSETTVIRPSANLLYANAFLDLRRQPMVLQVPEMTGRYYLVPMLDAYTNDFVSIGTRTTGSAAGAYAIVGPGWHGTLPSTLSGVIHAPTNDVWVIGRVLVYGASDLPAAVAAEEKITLVGLADYGLNVKPPKSVPVHTPNPNFTGHPINTSPGFSQSLFYAYADNAVKRDPPPRDEFAAVANLRKVTSHANEFTTAVIQAAEAKMIASAKPGAWVSNDWSTVLDIGSYGKNYALRALIAQTGLGANIPADAVYPSAKVDTTGAALNGANAYTIHFPPGGTPPIGPGAFWSITMYNAQGLLVANPANVYSVGSTTGLTPNADGSIDIYIQSTQPTTVPLSNWLPSPPNAPFNMSLRIYWPQPSVLNKSYVIPGVVPGTAAP